MKNDPSGFSVVLEKKTHNDNEIENLIITKDEGNAGEKYGERLFLEKDTMTDKYRLVS